MLKARCEPFASDMSDDTKPLSYYGVKHGSFIPMQSSDFKGKWRVIDCLTLLQSLGSPLGDVRCHLTIIHAQKAKDADLCTYKSI